MLIFRDVRLKIRSAAIVATLPLRRPVAVDVLGMVARANYLVKQGAGATGNLLNLVMDASEKDARCISLYSTSNENDGMPTLCTQSSRWGPVCS